MVKLARQRRFGTVQKAIRVSGLNRATWLRIEAGDPVREDSLITAEVALGWEPGTVERLMTDESLRVIGPMIGPDGELLFGHDEFEASLRRHQGLPPASQQTEAEAETAVSLELISDEALLAELGRRLGRAGEEHDRSAPTKVGPVAPVTDMNRRKLPAGAEEVRAARKKRGLE